MSIVKRSVSRLAAELSAVRRDDDGAALEAFARALLGSVAEPGDGLLGRVVAALGPVESAELLLESAPAERIAGRVTEVGESLDQREAAAGLERWLPRIEHAAFVRSLAQAARVDARLLIPGDPEWPAGVDELGVHAPLLLWIRGRADALNHGRPSIALVGARAATGYGEHVAMEASAGLVDRGFTIVSGGAYGIDGMAHRSALASDGVTVAFLAGGVDRFYPMGHEALLSRIAATGAVVSELGCGAAPTKWRFLQRNRLIAAASEATVVLEAGMRSGSLNTAGHAAALGRPLGAVPGPVTSPASGGCHRLLREYDAVCVVDAGQMAELVGDHRSGMRPSAGDGDGAGAPYIAAASPNAVRVIDALSVRSPRSLDEVAKRCGMAATAVMSVLGALEAEGVAVRHSEGWRRSRAT
ncbi:DNA-processing protein DprA [Agromyces sp. ISL-38]|uniref:DNA-processing protein DprA n=1 Tax=Agromyces sp. ISL-38 TaxID=2819107 RepID=UPI001BE992C9|nr:DNA-processing protein DprA [Agromyces sp. ISL-38]MBT2499738.1 DNA-processing protein DprA [Agromyces sp. ISL-38]MBT2516114.1 DNA-processing protein DprA [Streptomyces sp. ISL-90]